MTEKTACRCHCMSLAFSHAFIAINIHIYVQIEFCRKMDQTIQILSTCIFHLLLLGKTPLTKKAHEKSITSKSKV
jgi:hypothetical protein